MYENMTYERIQRRVLARVSPQFDKREGSIIFDATAPISFELAEAYIMAQVILRETFATTASREFLVLRAAEYNIYPEEATPAEVEGKFNRPIDLGTRFNFDKYNFVTVDVINPEEYTYKLVCETPGIGGNTCIGDVTPITQIGGLEVAKITKLITPGEDEEDTEVFRQRYMKALKSKAYGGNGDDYDEKVRKIHGVGGVKTYRCWNGGGTVKCVIIDTQYNSPDAEMIEEVQQEIDPTQDGKGYGVAPIGHIVTVVGATKVPINIEGTITPESGYTVDGLMSAIKAKINEYLLDRKVEWSTQSDKNNVTVRSAFILTKILDIKGIEDASISFSGGTSKIELATDAIPELGTLKLVQGV